MPGLCLGLTPAAVRLGTGQGEKAMGPERFVMIHLLLQQMDPVGTAENVDRFAWPGSGEDRDDHGL